MNSSGAVRARRHPARSLTTRGVRARKPLPLPEEPMQVTISEISPVEKKVAVEIPWPYVAQKLDEAYKDLSRGVALKGFRKGKVPRPMLEKMFGRQVEQEVVKQLVQESFVTAAQPARHPAGGRADRRRRAPAQGAVVPLLGARRGALDRRAEGLRRRSSWAQRPAAVSDADVDARARAQAPGADRVQGHRRAHRARAPPTWPWSTSPATSASASSTRKR